MSRIKARQRRCAVYEVVWTFGSAGHSGGESADFCPPMPASGVEFRHAATLSGSANRGVTRDDDNSSQIL
jgi:hypothetical protein